MTVDGHRHSKRVEAGEHLQRLMAEHLDRTPPETNGAVHDVGSLGGLTITARLGLLAGVPAPKRLF